MSTNSDRIRKKRSALPRPARDFRRSGRKKVFQMEKQEIAIRTASEADAGEILRIYAPYVANTAVTFECDVPSLDEISRRIRDTLQTYPYLVALEEGRVVGYTYASAFKRRAAYAWSVETSIYVERGLRGNGIGKRLYLALEDALRRQNIINLNACVAYTAAADIHLDNASSAFHQRMGYREAAHFTKCGYKFGTWYDMIWMEKMLGDHPQKPDPVIPFQRLPGTRA